MQAKGVVAKVQQAIAPTMDREGVRSLISQKTTSIPSEACHPGVECFKLLKDSIFLEAKEEALMRSISEGLRQFAQVTMSISSFSRVFFNIDSSPRGPC